MVAAGITIALAAVMIAIVVSVMSSSQRSMGKLVGNNSAKAVMDQIERDIESCLYRADGNTWFAVTILDGSDLASRGWAAGSTKPNNVVIDATSNEDYRFGQAGMWLRFFSTAPGMGIAGSRMINPDPPPPDTIPDNRAVPAAISYQIGRRKRGGSTSYYLFRSQVRPGNFVSETLPGPALGPQDAGTFQVGYQLDPAASNLYSSPDNSKIGNPGTIWLPHNDDALAQDIIDFGVRLFAADGTLLFPLSGQDHYFANAGTSPAQMPTTIEVIFRVLSPQGAQLIQNLEAGLISGDWWEIAVAHSTVYVSRIDVRAKSF